MQYSFVTHPPCWIENEASREAFEFPKWRTIIAAGKKRRSQVAGHRLEEKEITII